MANERWFVFRRDTILLVKDNDEVHLPDNNHFKTHMVRAHAFGQFNNLNCFCAELQDDFSSEATTFIPLKRAFELLGNEWYVAAAKAYSIINWDKNNQFCGRCGEQTIHLPNVFERKCPSCGLTVYPRISPSIIVLIKKGDELLMARSPHFPKGAFALIAGFVEVGEGIEDAVHREVFEEVGLTIKNLKYFGSQSWPFPDSLMIGFTADYDQGDLKIDPQEIEEAGWYHFQEMPGRPTSHVSIASQLIEHFIQERAQHAKK